MDAWAALELDLAFGEAWPAEVQAREEAARAARDWRFDLEGWLTEKLGAHIWAGIDGHHGLLDIVQATQEAVNKLWEREQYESGRAQAEDLRWYTPGEFIQWFIRIDGCHSSGKTWLLSRIAVWFFDEWGPCIVKTYAPSADSVNKLLWNEIRATCDHPDIHHTPQATAYMGTEDPKWYAQGTATSNAKGTGRERIQGAHADRMMFVFDEAEGIEEFVWKACDTMMAGGFVIAFAMANPRTRTSTYYKRRTAPEVLNLRLNGLYHPNVYHGRLIVPGGAITRDWVLKKLREECERVNHPDPDRDSFELPWARGEHWIPSADFLYQVLALAPANVALDTFVPVGRFEAAVARGVRAKAGELPPGFDGQVATLGLDPARFGSDEGTLYVFWQGVLWREAVWGYSSSGHLITACVDVARKLAAQGVRRYHLRVDAGGGYGSGVVDLLPMLDDVRGLFDVFEIIEVNAEGVDLPSGASDHFKNWATAGLAAAAEVLKVAAVVDPPPKLMRDLTERRVDGVLARGRWLKVLESKDHCKKRWGGDSPNDGDGATLALIPVDMLRRREIRAEPILF